MKIGGIIENSNLTFYKIVIKKDRPGAAAVILKFYAENNINLEYITESGTENGSAVMAVCVKCDDVAAVDNFIEKNEANLSFLKITKIEEVTLIGIYGPHFREKNSIAARYCALLGAADINILGISSSVSSICCLVHANEAEAAKKEILKQFELP